MSKYIKLDNNTLNNMTEFLKRHFSVSECDKISCVECRSLAEKILSFLPTIDIVRCEDCVWRDKDNQGDDYCTYAKGLADIGEESFCSWGNRIKK